MALSVRPAQKARLSNLLKSAFQAALRHAREDLMTQTSQSAPLGPAHIYYAGAQGHWRGTMQATIHDPFAVIRSMGLFNAISVLLMGYLPSWLGKIYLETTVHYQPDKPVRHTTTVYWWGIPMMASEEFVYIHKDGIQFSVQGTSHFKMMPWRRVSMDGHGHIDATATHATYELKWLGTNLIQKTDRHDHGVVLKQSSPGFSARQELTSA